MSVRLQWKSTASGMEGVFVVRDRGLALTVFADGHLDRAVEDAGEAPGLEIAAPDADGKVLLTATHGLVLESGGRSFDKVKLPPGGKVAYRVDGATGELTATAAGRADDPLVGRELGGYRVLARLGNGAMGIVYRALQTNLDREVALKVLAPEAAKAPLAVASFKREAVAAGRLSHPNLVQVYDVGAEQGLHFFSMELVPGGDLEDRLKESGPLPYEEALHYVADAAMALSFAQEHHLVHRDVKPENLMLTVDGRVKLADLGMAATRGMVEKESAGGTPHFLAPECVAGQADHRADLYSLGCSLYRLLTGRTPYSGATVKEILRAHRDADIPSVRALVPEVPAGVDDLVAWMMAKDPAERPQDAAEVVEACEELLHPRRSKGMLIGLGAVAVAAIGVAVFFAMQPPPEQADPERIVVEVGAEEAEAERARAARLERELAFANAMRAAAGEERIAALEGFLERYPEADQADNAREEIERLRALPEDDGSGAGGAAGADPDAAALRALEGELAGALERGAYGEAHALLAGATLPAELLVPLLGSLKQATDSAFAKWEGAHAAALAAAEFDRADQVHADFVASFGSADVPAEWRQRAVALAAAGTRARREAADQAFRDARLAVLEVMHGTVQPAVLRMDLATAADALRAAAADCPHPGLAEALHARVALLESAGRAADAMLSRLDGSGELSITEPLEGRRAFLLGADAEGLRMLVQERGERVERLLPWTAFATPAALAGLFEGLAPADGIPAAERAALTVVYASACTARAAAGWNGLPSAAEAQQLADLLQGWLAMAPVTMVPAGDAALAAERFQLVQFQAFCEALGAGESYLALQRAREAAGRFGLLAGWLSDGDSPWQFQP